MRVLISILLSVGLLAGVSVVKAEHGPRHKARIDAPAYLKGGAHAQKQTHKGAHRPKREASQKRPGANGREKAIKSVKKHYPGKVLSVKPYKELGPTIYRVRVLSADGRVRSVLVDSETGRILRKKGS